MASIILFWLSLGRNFTQPLIKPHCAQQCWLAYNIFLHVPTHAALK